MITHCFEQRARRRGFKTIAGIDEAGRGPLAGPVVAAACVLDEDLTIEGVNDSKQLSALERYRLYEEIIAHPGVAFGIGVVDALRIDQINILQATFEAMLLAVAALSKKTDEVPDNEPAKMPAQTPAPIPARTPDYLLVDGSQLPQTTISAEAIVRGDCLSPSIAAASILAKETRDRIMIAFHETWPHYDFNKHKGYPTKEHFCKLQLHGPSPIHRFSFNLQR